MPDSILPSPTFIVEAIDAASLEGLDALASLQKIRQRVEGIGRELGFVHDDARSAATGPHVPGRILHVERQTARALDELARLQADLERMLGI